MLDGHGLDAEANYLRGSFFFFAKSIVCIVVVVQSYPNMIVQKMLCCSAHSRMEAHGKSSRKGPFPSIIVVEHSHGQIIYQPMNPVVIIYGADKCISFSLLELFYASYLASFWHFDL